MALTIQQEATLYTALRSVFASDTDAQFAARLIHIVAQNAPSAALKTAINSILTTATTSLQTTVNAIPTNATTETNQLNAQIASINALPGSL